MTAVETVDPVGSVTAASTVVRQSRWLAVSGVIVGLLNYTYSLAMTRLLAPEVFADFAAAQSLLLICGTLATSSVPWVVARVLAERGQHEAQRHQVVWFSFVVNLAQGVVAAVVMCVIGMRFLDAGSLAAVAVGSVAIFLTTTPGGWLQGTGRFSLLAVFRVLEVLVKLLVGAVLVVAGAEDEGALAGVAAGALLVVLVGLVLMRQDLRYTRGALRVRELWLASVGNVGIQGLVAVMASADVVLVAVLDGGSQSSGSYQASTILARVPVFLAGALGIAAFPTLVGNAHAARRVRAATTASFGWLAGCYAVALVTAPVVLVTEVFPGYDAVDELLRWTAPAGLFMGGINLVTTYYQAAASYARAVRVLAVATALHLLVLLVGWWLGGVQGVAVASPAVPMLTVAVLLAGAEARLSAPPRRVVRAGAGVAVSATVLLLAARPLWPLWLVLATVLGLVALRRAMTASPSHLTEMPGRSNPAHERLAVLHLAFEDHRRPGSGGGAYRTHEVARRMASDADVTVVTTTWRGARDRVEDGVHYVHVGVAGGYLVEVLTYFLLLPLVVRRYRADVVVEDFAAPISSALVPLYVRRTPVVAMVQWLNAEEKSAQYHLPLHRMQRWGVRLHSRFIAVSEDIATRLREANPAAEVTIVPNGVDQAAFELAGDKGADIVFLGRLEIAQKGLDLLVDAVARVRDRLPGRVLLVGDGPDEAAVRHMIEQAGLQDVVTLVGRLSGDARLHALRAARLTVMPSRFETFGIVAVESEAAGTPVVAFDIPCLREVVPVDAGRLVPPFDVDALAAAMVETAADADRAARMGQAGRRFARRFDWDLVAQAQLDVLVRAAGKPGVAVVVPTTGAAS